MELFTPEQHVTKQFILSRVPQQEIMEYYLGVPVQCNRKFCSPLRSDKYPTCNFWWSDERLWFRDWSESEPKDCFDVVAQMYGEEFNDVLQRIGKDFNIIEGTNNIDPEQLRSYKERVKQEQSQYTSSQKSRIHVSLQKFTNTDIAYLKDYHLTSDILNTFNVFSPKSVWLNGQQIYFYRPEDPALAYYFGNDEKGHQKWKIYFYKRQKNRFISNTSRINGWIQLPDKEEYLIITKALKDVMCFYKFGVPAIAMQGESQIPYDYIIDELTNRFSYLVTFMDWDQAGQSAAWKIRDLYNIPATFLTDGKFGTATYRQKDFSDYLKTHGEKKSQELVRCILNYAETNQKTKPQ